MRQRLFRATAAATVVLLGLLGAVAYTVVDVAHATRWIDHSHQVRASLQRLLQSLVDAETGQRGYLVTGDRKFLEPYAAGRDAWRGELERVRELTSDDAPQLERAADFETTAAQMLDELEQAVRRHDGGEPAAALAPSVERAKTSMDRLRGIVEDMEADEAECVIERQTEAANRFHTLLLLTIATGLASMLVIGSLWMQRRNVEARAAAARRLGLLVDRMPGLAWTARPDGLIDYCSEQFLQTFGLTLDAMAQDGWLRTVHPEDRGRVAAEWSAAMKSASPYVQQVRQRHMDGGEYRWYLARANPIRDERGAVTQWAGCLTDIDDIRRLGDEVRTLLARAEEARALADAVIDNAPLGVAVLDHELRFTRVNPRVCELSGIAPAAHEGRTPMELFQMPSEQIVREAKMVLASGRPLATEIDGHGARSWRVHWFPVVGGDEPTALGAILEEITDRKALEAARDANDRFRETFVAMLGHDLRTPLQAMLTSAGLIKRRAVTLEERRTAEQMERSGRRMGKMIEQLLDLTRARLAGGIPIRRAPTDLARVVTLAVEEAQHARPSASIDFDIEGPTLGAWDEDRLLQVLSNLLGNAIDHGEGSPVRVTLRGSEAGVALRVVNGGAPIPAELLAHVFDPFRRAAREGRHAPRGLGLGLYISEQLVRAHGGSIGVASSAEEGTKFEVWLPYARDDGPAPRELASAQA